LIWTNSQGFVERSILWRREELVECALCPEDGGDAQHILDGRLAGALEARHRGNAKSGAGGELALLETAKSGFYHLFVDD